MQEVKRKIRFEFIQTFFHIEKECEISKPGHGDIGDSKKICIDQMNEKIFLEVPQKI